REVLQENFIVALPGDHPLLACDVLHPTELSQLPVFTLARRYAPGFYDELMQALARQGAHLPHATELGEFTTMLALV
ncbi:LysR substrate-binding domain-containing protein, partial [Roseburia faecis]|nr:LysR substrate-binding domain-containing protein [Roseburia faecis]